MKTRADIYRQEAAELLREISMYPGLSEQQLVRFHPGKEDKIRNLLVHLQRQGRTVLTETGSYFPRGGSIHAVLMPDLSARCGCS